MHVKDLAIVLPALPLVVACSGAAEPQPSEEQILTVLIDAPSPGDEGLAFTEYFPSSFSVHPGDDVRFENQGTMNPHSVTFGAEADGSTMPYPILPNGDDNPAMFEPCASESPPTATMTACPDPVSSVSALPPYTGAGFWSSGIEDSTFVFELNPAIEPGSYPFFCTLHLGMGGTMEVVPDDQPIPPASEVASEAAADQEAALARAEGETTPPEPSAPVEGPVVIAGWGATAVNVNLFAPATLDIEAGSTVTWSAEAAYEHKVTFAQLVDGEVIDSGDFSKLEGQPTTFSVAFPEPGTYGYACVYHAPTMTGVIRVE